MKKIFTTTLRLDLDDPEQLKAFRNLKSMDKSVHRSYSKVIAAALNMYFERQEKKAQDPYLETREKEDAFLDRLIQTITNALGTMPPQCSDYDVKLHEQENKELMMEFLSNFG